MTAPTGPAYQPASTKHEGGAPRHKKLCEFKTPHRPAYYESAEFFAFVEDIRLHGILVPVIESALGNVVDGYRRLIAAEMLGLETAPYTVNASIDTLAKEVGAQFSTEQRSARNDAAHARTLGAYMAGRGNPTQKQVAAELGVDETSICRFLMVLKYPDDVIEALGNNRIAMAHIQSVNPLPDAGRKLELLRMAIADPKLSAAKLKRLAFPKQAKRKSAAKEWRFEESGVTATVGVGVDLVAFQSIWGKVKEAVEARFKGLSKKDLPVVQVMSSVTVAVSAVQPPKGGGA